MRRPTVEIVGPLAVPNPIRNTSFAVKAKYSHDSILLRFPPHLPSSGYCIYSQHIYRVVSDTFIFPRYTHIYAPYAFKHLIFILPKFLKKYIFFFDTFKLNVIFLLYRLIAQYGTTYNMHACLPSFFIRICIHARVRNG